MTVPSPDYEGFVKELTELSRKYGIVIEPANVVHNGAYPFEQAMKDDTKRYVFVERAHHATGERKAFTWKES